MRPIIFLLAAISLLLFPVDAYAQGCAMCSTAVDAAGDGQRRALLQGVLVLLLPVLGLLTTIGVVTWRMRHAQATPVAARSASGDPTG